MAAKAMSDELLRETVAQCQKYGGYTRAGNALGVPPATMQRRWERAKARGLTPSTAPMHDATDGYLVKGTSTLVGAEGETKLQWIKTHIDADKFRAMTEAACRAAAEKVKPLARIAAPMKTSTDLATLYTLTDCHVGMLAWGKETGEPWDLEIAERTLTEAMLTMMESAPPAHTGIVNQLGDFLHFDSLKPLTPEHGHILDADSRYQKIVEIAVRILRRVVEGALVKHKHVQVYMHEGNHDPAGSVWLRVLFSALYAKNGRVSVEQSPLPYTAFQWGKTMLGFHHGHLSKNNSLPLYFAAKFPEIWGATTKRYIHTGHRHHVEEKEHPGTKVIQHPTLAAEDAYAARGGWISERQATSMTYHKEAGEVARGIFIP